MNDEEIHKKIIQLVRENNSNPKGITKNELARIFTERWGTTRTTIWDEMKELLLLGVIELRRIKKKQHALFITKETNKVR